jgi:serine/threonine protein kinase
VISDFGIAAMASHTVSASATATATTTAAGGGTAQYMAPEQFDSDQQTSTAVDIWAWACIMIEMIGGHPPWCGVRCVLFRRPCWLRFTYVTSVLVKKY